MNDEHLEHIGIKGMRWGIRKKIAEGHGRAAQIHMKRAENADKLFPKGGTLHRKAAERHKRIVERLKQPIKHYEPMSKADKKFFTKAAKGVGLALGMVGSAAISSYLMNRAMNKYYARKAADAIGAMLLNKQARSIIHLP